VWAVATTSVFDKGFAGQNEDAQAEIIAKVNLLKLLGPQLGRPHADTLKGSRHANLKELRADTRDKVLRIAFTFDPTRGAILLVAGNKASVKQRPFYRQLIAQADALYDAHLAKRKKRKHEKG
jgi:hypothetical protein